MGVMDRLAARFGYERRREPIVAPASLALADGPDVLGDLPLSLDARRNAADQVAEAGRAALKAADAVPARPVVEAINPGIGLTLDSDDYLYRRITGNPRTKKRDLTPVQQDRMLEIAWYLWEQNAFAKRLITFMTDLILGDGVTIECEDERLQEVVDAMWNHRINQLATRLPELHNALSLNGELFLPVEINPVTGGPVFGFIDPAAVKVVEYDPKNVLLPTAIVLTNPSTGSPVGPQDRLRVVAENPATGLLEGEVFYFPVNRLPNSSRGRSDLLPLADWLDLYDQYLFAEVERLHLLSSFVWDYTIEDADPKVVAEKVKALPNPKPGSVFGHNQKEKLEARTPDLKAADRSEAGRMLRTHIAGSYGFPLSYLGEIDSNRSTIEGQNDVMMKTPARKQRELAAMISMMVRFAVEQAQAKNGALFRDAKPGFRVRMPEIQTKDVSRVATVLAGVVSAMDTAMANKTASRQLAVTVTLALIKHLGVEADPMEVIEQADLEAEERQKIADEMQAQLAAKGLGGKVPGPGDPRNDDEDEDEEEDDDDDERAREAEATATT